MKQIFILGKAQTLTIENAVMYPAFVHHVDFKIYSSVNFAWTFWLLKVRSSSNEDGDIGANGSS